MTISSAFWRKALFERMDQKICRSLLGTEMDWGRALKMFEPRYECLWCVWRNKWSSGRNQCAQGEWVITSPGQWQRADQEGPVCHTKEFYSSPSVDLLLCDIKCDAFSPSWFLHNIHWNLEVLEPRSLQSMQMFWKKAQPRGLGLSGCGSSVAHLEMARQRKPAAWEAEWISGSLVLPPCRSRQAVKVSVINPVLHVFAMWPWRCTWDWGLRCEGLVLEALLPFFSCAF